MKETIVKLAYFGAAAFKITTSRGKRILVDPYLTENPMCDKKLDYFYDVDLIVVSHGAFDHMGDTVEIMKESKAVLVCGPEVEKYSLQMGVPKERIRTAVYGVENEFERIRVKAVDARHVSRVMSKSGDILYYGIPMGFVISTEDNIRIYHTGDTSLFGDLRLIGMLYKPNILLIGIAGVAEQYHADISPSEAALATLWVAPDAVVPMHYPPGSAAPSEFRKAVKVVAPNVQPVIMKPNTEITYRKYQLKVD